MALPNSIRTGRTAYLQGIVDIAGAQIKDWSRPTESELALIGKLIVMYSYLDMFLVWFAELLDRSGMLKDPWKGKVDKLKIGQIEKAVRSAPDWSDANLEALDLIGQFRTVRNLAAHFAIKRIPNEWAFLFITKSAADFKKILNKEPQPGAILTAVCDVDQIRKVVLKADGLVAWLSKATVELNQLIERR